MILTGLIHTKFPEESYTGQSGKTFRKTLIWLQEVNAQYPNRWQIEFWNDDAKVLKGYDTGSLVNVNFAVLGRVSKKNGEEFVYNTIRGLSITRLK